MTVTKKQFKDFDISDFEDMGSLPKCPKSTTRHRVSMPFIKSVKGTSCKPYTKNAVSNLADVI